MSGSIEDLLELMRRLREPAGGCPWDREQTLASLVKHTLEEAYEVADVIERGDLTHLPGELGDLLFQVVFYAQIGAEEGRFDFRSVVAAIHAKLVHRHPHVFGSEVALTSANAQADAWETLKAEERKRGHEATSELDDVPLGLPALSRASKLQRRAARVGFDWVSADPVFAKIQEEIAELRAAIADGAPTAAQTEELGDLLFAVVNLGRHLGIDAEQAMRAANAKFERRFRHIESQLADQGLTPSSTTLTVMDALWEDAKRRGL